MNAIGEYWNTLGKEMEAGVGDPSRINDVFPTVAADVLAKVPAPRITAMDIADWMIESGSLPVQVNFHSSFGEPPLVVYQTPDFYLEVLFWFPSPTAIHGHAFTGAFVVLDGHSIQVEYDFHEEQAPEEGVRLGRLEPRSLELISPGKVCAILPDSQYIHTVTHLGNPSLTLVARTFSNSTERQYRFHRCGFAVWSSAERDVLTRQAEVMAAIRSARPAEFPGKLIQLLARLNDRRFYGVLEITLNLLGPTAFAKEVLPLLDASLRPAVVAAVRERVRTRSLWAAMRAFPNPRAQIQCALSDLFPEPAERDAILRKSYGEGAEKLPDQWRDLIVAAQSA